MTEQSYGRPPAPHTASDGMQLAGLVLGVASVGLCWLFVVGFVAGLVGVIMSGIGVFEGRDRNAGRGIGIAGLATSLIGLLMGAALLLAVALD